MMRHILPAILVLAALLVTPCPGQPADPEIRDLLADLSDPEAYTRKVARTALAGKGAVVVPALTGMLDAKSPELRLEAVLVLSEMALDVPGVVPLLVRAFGDEATRVRTAAGAGLSRRGAAAIAPLMAWASADAKLRERVVAILIEMGPENTGAVTALIGFLGDETKAVRVAAARGLAKHGVPVVKPVAKALSSPDPKVRGLAVAILALIGPQAKGVVSSLVAALGDEAESVRNTAVNGLARWGSTIVPILTDDLRHSDPVIRAGVVRVLATIGPDVRGVLEALLTSLDNGPDAVRAEAVKGLAKARPDVVPKLVTRLRTRGSDVQAATANALGAMGPRARAAVPALERALRSRSPEVREAARRALLAIDPSRRPPAEPPPPKPPREPRDVKTLLGVLGTKDPTARRQALLEVAAHGPAAREAMPKAMSLLRDRDTGVRAAAVTALGRMGPDAAVAAFEALPKSYASHRPWLHAVIWAVGADAVPRLVPFLTHEDRDTRVAAATALWLLGPRAKDAAPALTAALSDSAGIVRRRSAEALGRLGADALPAVPRLVEVLEDPEARAQREAAQALAEVVLAHVDGPPKRRATGDARKLRASLERALAWLATHQDSDGKWSPDKFMKHDTAKPASDGAGGPWNVGVTALVALTFIESGALDPEGEHVAARARTLAALSFLVTRQNPDGCIGSSANKPSGHSYSHMIATLALCEGWRRTQAAHYGTAARRGLEYIEKARNPYLAWRYGVRPQDNDTSVSTWAVLALLAGRRGGLQVEPAAFQGMLNWIEKVTEPAYGRVGYQARGGQPARPPRTRDRFPPDKSEALTAEAILVRMLLGEDPSRSEMIQKGTELCLRCLPRWDEQSGGIDMYFWYFGTRALCRYGGNAWKTWEPAVTRALLGAQREKGAAAGSWDPAGAWGHAGGRVYATAIAALTIELCDSPDAPRGRRRRCPKEARPALDALRRIKKESEGELEATITRALAAIDVKR